jgi:hypothetical protein
LGSKKFSKAILARLGFLAFKELHDADVLDSTGKSIIRDLQEGHYCTISLIEADNAKKIWQIILIDRKESYYLFKTQFILTGTYTTFYIKRIFYMNQRIKQKDIQTP